MVPPSDVKLETHASMRHLGRAVWEELAGPDPPPYLRWDWLDALERTRCVSPQRGWIPCHVTLKLDGELVAAAPAYLKSNSEGEFVFDHAWARFAERELGVGYYPKLVVAVPFTPANGPRVVVRAGVSEEGVMGVLARALPSVAEQLGASGVHLLFADSPTIAEFARAGYVERHGIQHHFENPGYASFDEFLARFNAKRRAQIRRERRTLTEAGVRIMVVTGRDITEEMVERMHLFYCDTVDRYLWGRRYLNLAFFREVCARMPDAIHLVLAREGATGRWLGGAFNLLGKHALYGRYWGASEQRPFLHFNVCFYAAIEDVIARRLERFEPGAGGEHKHPRGFEPRVTRSAHRLRDPALADAVADFCRRERAAVDHLLRETSPVLRAIPAAAGP